MQLIWSKKADITFGVILDTIEAKFGKRVALKFILKVNTVVTSIKKQPLQFKASSKFLNVRKATINKQCSLFYEINKTDIHLLYFWDNRQEPID
jgi:plasmid stabilization system protein ParE